MDALTTARRSEYESYRWESSYTRIKLLIYTFSLGIAEIIIGHKEKGTSLKEVPFALFLDDPGLNGPDHLFSDLSFIPQLWEQA